MFSELPQSISQNGLKTSPQLPSKIPRVRPQQLATRLLTLSSPDRVIRFGDFVTPRSGRTEKGFANGRVNKKHRHAS